MNFTVKELIISEEPLKLIKKLGFLCIAELSPQMKESDTIAVSASTLTGARHIPYGLFNSLFLQRQPAPERNG